MKRIVVLIVFAFVTVYPISSSSMNVRGDDIEMKCSSQQDDLYIILKECFREALEQFCRDFYQGAFGKIYKYNSIFITKIDFDENNFVINVMGYHSYFGKNYGLGRQEHNGVPFQATISVVFTGVDIIFYKWYEPDFKYPNGIWEKYEKIVPFNY
jgi:hypothetical protein